MAPRAHDSGKAGVHDNNGNRLAIAKLKRRIREVEVLQGNDVHHDGDPVENVEHRVPDTIQEIFDRDHRRSISAAAHVRQSEDVISMRRSCRASPSPSIRVRHAAST
jgi:hypothetical protein